MAYDMENVPAKSGRILGEDGEVYNLVDLLQNVGGGGMDPNDYYTKEEVDDLLSKKANSSSLASKADKTVLDELAQTVADLQAEVEALKGEG
ncbi:MAG TPA: hypothetical protein VK107_05335 [Alloiococcus sp.]|nr:hypothetical protein [Alloiococcus sp.]